MSTSIPPCLVVVWIFVVGMTTVCAGDCCLSEVTALPFDCGLQPLRSEREEGWERERERGRGRGREGERERGRGGGGEREGGREKEYEEDEGDRSRERNNFLSEPV